MESIVRLDSTDPRKGQLVPSMKERSPLPNRSDHTFRATLLWAICTPLLDKVDAESERLKYECTTFTHKRLAPTLTCNTSHRTIRGLWRSARQEELNTCWKKIHLLEKSYDSPLNPRDTDVTVQQESKWLWLQYGEYSICTYKAYQETSTSQLREGCLKRSIE